MIGERRFLGLYTTRAYKASPRSIPIIRGKVEGVLERAEFPPASHDRKALLEILESYTRDSLFQMETRELYDLAIGILGFGERQRLRLFLWRDPLERFVECLVCIPRDRFNTENRERVGRILLEALGGVALDWTLQLSESRLARVHYIIRLGEDPVTAYDVATIEARLVQTIRAWEDELREALIDEHGEEDGIRLFKRYERAFPAGYKSDWVARSAVADIGRIEELAITDEPITSLYRPLESPEGIVRLKLFSSGGVLLSEVLPTLEHLGAKVADERPYEITPADRGSVWIYDFGLQADAENTERVRDLLHDTFLGVWRGELEDDGLNGLVLGATLTGRQVSIIRAVAKYLRQGGIGFSDSYIGRTLLGHPAIVRLLIRLFDARLDPDAHDEDAARAAREGDRGGARRRSQPRRGSDPPELPVGGPGDRPHQHLPDRPRRQAPPVPVVQARRAQIPVLPLPGRSSRSSSTRRASRRCICAAAAWPAAASAGRTGPRTSGPRCSG